jgi:hypothetical protein
MTRFSGFVGFSQAALCLAIGTVAAPTARADAPVASVPSPPPERPLEEARQLEKRADDLVTAAAALDRQADEMERAATRLREEARSRVGRDRTGRLADAEDLAARSVLARAQAVERRRQADGARARASELRRDAIEGARGRASAMPPSGLVSIVSVGSACAVTVDGQARGSTPVFRLRLAQGLHEVACRASDGSTVDRRVFVVEGTEQRILFALTTEANSR